jgi:transposase
MAYIQGTDRLQTALFCLEDFIAPDAPVRVVDAFCEQVDYVTLDFRGKFSCDHCRPNYHPALLLRIYLYGYLNGIRSSRKLQQECTRNLELMWLCNNLHPKYHTIADFRKLHALQIREVFRQFVALMCQWKLVGKKTIAIDGSRYRAQNSKKNNYSDDKIRRQMAYIDHKVSEYLEEMNQIDQKEKTKAKDIKRLIELTQDEEIMQERKKQYQQFQQQLKQNKITQISTVDVESRALVIKTDVVEVAYNTQVATDDKNNLIVHYEVTNGMDRKALHHTALCAKENMSLGDEQKISVLADRGYFNSEQHHACRADHIITYVPLQGNQPHSGIPAKGYRGEDFSYHRKSDSYTCPQGHELTTNGRWYIKKYMSKDGKGEQKSAYLMKHYKTEGCLQCPVLHLCTTNKKGRLMERSQYAEAVEENLRRVAQHKEVYLRRQQIVEHAFGTIKRGWGYGFTLLKGLKKVSADMGLVYLCYNLKRVMNILTPQKMLQKLQLAA